MREQIAGVENAGVEKGGVDSRGGKCRCGKCRSDNVYGKPKFEKRLTVFTASNLKTVAKVHNIISYVECSTASYHNLWNFGTPTVMGLSPSGIYRRSTVEERFAEVHQKLTTSLIST